MNTETSDEIRLAAFADMSKALLWRVGVTLASSGAGGGLICHVSTVRIGQREFCLRRRQMVRSTGCILSDTLIPLHNQKNTYPTRCTKRTDDQYCMCKVRTDGGIAALLAGSRRRWGSKSRYHLSSRCSRAINCADRLGTVGRTA
jgi:hypothetical protein